MSIQIVSTKQDVYKRQVMDINRFAEHIASHGCVYKRADIVALLTMAVDCMREQLLGGHKIQLGDLGDFSISINSIGAEKMCIRDRSICAIMQKLRIFFIFVT